MAEELRTIHFHYEAAAHEKRAPNEMTGFLPDAQWQLRKEVLARHLPDGTWDALSPFMDSIPTSRRIVGLTPAGQPLPSNVAAKLADASDLSRDAYKLLTGDEPRDLS